MKERYMLHIWLCLLISLSLNAAEQKFNFEPVVGNGIHPMEAYNQEINHCSLFPEPVNRNNPVSVFSDLMRYLSTDIKKIAWQHFEQIDGKHRITIDQALRLAKLYQQENAERTKKEDPALIALLIEITRKK